MKRVRGTRNLKISAHLAYRDAGIRTLFQPSRPRRGSHIAERATTRTLRFSAGWRVADIEYDRQALVAGRPLARHRSAQRRYDNSSPKPFTSSQSFTRRPT